MRKWLKGVMACVLGTSMLLTQQGVSAADLHQQDKVSVVSKKAAEAADSELYVAKIDGISEDFIRGVDISSVYTEYQSGVKYYDFSGNELAFSKETGDKTFFDFLKESGVNWVRVRVWNNPYDADGNGYGGGNNDVATAKLIGKAATEAGLKVLIDFHYSDFWADPSKYSVPKAWKDMTLVQKCEALNDFTVKSLDELLDAGVDVSMVQVGNETNNGLSGETAVENVSELMKAGSKGVRTAAKNHGKDIMIALHYTNIQDNGTFERIAENLKKYDVDYDVMATSYYPFWHGTTANLTSVFKDIAEKYGKKVMVAETSYCYTMDDGDGSSNNVNADADGLEFNYQKSVQGQANAVADVLKAVADVGEAGLGAFYWEPAWIPVNVYDANAADAAEVLEKNKTAWEKYGSGWAASYAADYDPDDAGKYYGGSSWDNQAMFDFNGKPLESINVWKYVFTGTNAEIKLDEIFDCEYSVVSGEDWKMPETVTGKYTDNSEKQIAVVWNEEEVSAARKAGIGNYEISGKVVEKETTYDVKCKLSIAAKNLLLNPGFEEEDMSMWTITGDGVGREADSNKRSGEYSLKYWSAEPVSFTAEQKITLDKGIYSLSGYNQGSVKDNGEDAVYQLYAVIDGKTYSVNSSVTSWQVWENPVLAELKVEKDNTEVTIGIKTSANAGGWGAWDDLTLVKTADIAIDNNGGDTTDDGDKEQPQKVTKPAKVKNVKAVSGKKKMTVTWKKVAGADGYCVQYATDKKFSKKTTVTVKKCKTVITKLKTKKTYYVRVQAYKMDGNKKVKGSFSKVVKVK